MNGILSTSASRLAVVMGVVLMGSSGASRGAAEAEPLETHEWHSLSGTKITARMVEYQFAAQKVKLEKADGGFLVVALSQLDAKDVEYAEKQRWKLPQVLAGKIKTMGTVTVDLRYRAESAGDKFIEARLSPVPDVVKADRTLLLPDSKSAPGADGLEEGMISQLLWWDKIGWISIPKGKTPSDKEKWARQQFRVKTTSKEEDIATSVATYLARTGAPISRINATSLFGSLDMLVKATAGLDLVVADVAGYKDKAPAWVNPVVMVSVQADGAVSFLMWGRLFHGKMVLTPRNLAPPTKRDWGGDQAFYEIILAPDPDNPQMAHIQQNKWTLRWISPSPMMIFSPTSVVDPTPIAEDCKK